MSESPLLPPSSSSSSSSSPPSSSSSPQPASAATTSPVDGSLVITAQKAAGNDLLICTPVDELIAQVRKLVRWIWLLRWWLILGVVVGGGCGGLLGITLLRSHSAYATFRVLTAQHENPLGKFSREAIRFFNSPTNIFPSEALVAKTLERLDQKPPTSNQIYETRRKLDIIDYGGDIYEVSFRDANAIRALDFLRTHIQTYRDSEIERNLSTLSQEVERIKGTLATVTKRMESNQKNVGEFRTTNAHALPEFAREHTQHLRVREDRLAQLEAEHADLAIERTQLEQRFKDEPITIVVETTERREQIDVTAASTARLDVLRLQIVELRARGLRDAHPSIQRLLAEQVLLTRSPGQVLNVTPASKSPAAPPAAQDRNPTVAGVTEASKFSGNRTPRLTDNAESTLVENRPNERRTQMETRLDTIAVRMDQLSRQIANVNGQLVKARDIVVNVPLLENQYAEMSRGQSADINTYQQVAMVLEMAELQLQLESDSAASRLEQFNLPRLRFSSLMVKVLISTAVGAMVGFALASLIWSLLSLRRLVWPQGFVKGIVQDATGPGTP